MGDRPCDSEAPIFRLYSAGARNLANRARCSSLLMRICGTKPFLSVQRVPLDLRP